MTTDETAEARDLIAAERASRTRRPDAVQQMGTVAQPKRRPVRVDPKPARTTRPAAAPAVPVRANGNLAAVVNFALAQVGDRYAWGATGPNSWDCSALSMSAYARIGIRLPHQSGAQMRYGRPVSRAQLQPGDLIFWGGHVAISLGGNRMVHAANPRKGVLVASIYGSPVGYRRLVG